MLRIGKNPFMSLWLSAANRVSNTGRGVAMAAARRQQARAGAETAKAVTGCWAKALAGASDRAVRVPPGLASAALGPNPAVELLDPSFARYRLVRQPALPHLVRHPKQPQPPHALARDDRPRRRVPGRRE